MKFWQKAYICIMLVFFIGFDAVLLLLVTKSTSLSTQEKFATAENERYVIQKSLQSRISGISKLYEEMNAKNLKMYVAPYGDYYKGQGIFMELYYEGDLVYSNFLQTENLSQSENFLQTEKDRPELSIKPGDKSTILREVDGIHYYIVTGFLEEPYSNIKYVYIKDIQDLVDYKSEIIRYTVIIGIVIAVLLSVLLLVLLLKLNAPIRKLNEITKEIAGGHYEKRVEIKSRDEIGELAGNFNIMAESVNTHIRELSDITEERQRFIDNLAHEMRTPITAIMGYGEFLKYTNHTPEESIKAIDYIIRQSERMKNMAHKLIDLAGLGKMEITFETIELSEILTQVENTLVPNLKEKHLHIEKELQINLIQGDKDLMESLILNLMENAVRALPDEGIIKIKSCGAENGWTLSIADNGRGIEEDKISKIYEPFYRADKSRARAYGGAGLGMALCKQICDLHHADIEISSRLNKGTTVTIKFTNLPQLYDYSEIQKSYDIPATKKELQNNNKGANKR